MTPKFRFGQQPLPQVPPPPAPASSGAGTVAAVLGGLAALGSIAYAATRKPQVKFGRPAVKKPCNCGR